GLLGTFNQLDRADLIERSAQPSRSLVLKDRPLDTHKIALAVVIHLTIASEDNTPPVGIFLPKRGITQQPHTTVDMHVKQLPGELAEVRGASNTLLISTVHIKRVAGLHFHALGAGWRKLAADCRRQRLDTSLGGTRRLFDLLGPRLERFADTLVHR